LLIGALRKLSLGHLCALPAGLAVLTAVATATLTQFLLLQASLAQLTADLSSGAATALFTITPAIIDPNAAWPD